MALDGLAKSKGLRVIAPDRPGYGLSDFKPRRSIPDWASDVSELAGRLGLEKFAVLGVSGGGPYAAACAGQLPDRLTAAGMVCSVAPLEAPDATKGMVGLTRWLLFFARHAPWLAQKLAGTFLMAIWGKGEQPIPPQIEARLSETDQRALSNPDLRQMLTDSSIEALRRGVAGAAWDGLLYSRPWGFRLQEIRARVHLWQGERDVIVPAAMGHYLARMIPHCEAKFYPEDGHFSLAFSRMEEIVEALDL